VRSIRGAALGLVVAMALGLSACAGGHISLGTSAGACFKALPPAEVAVHDKGKLVGVRKVNSATLRARLTHDTTLATLPAQDLCVFAFNGTYAPGSVTGAHNTKAGQYAVVAVGPKHPIVVAAFVVDQLPTRFRHTH
jgi:hypothetical protein